MKDRPSQGNAKRKRLEQGQFDDGAKHLNLRLEPSDNPTGKPRTVGVAFMMAKRTVNVQVSKRPKPVDAKDGREIRKLVKSWESIHPDQYKKTWKDHATNPHIGVGDTWVGIVNNAAANTWLKSKALAKAMKDYPPHSPRKVKLSNIKIVYIGATRAAVTYRIEEKHANGRATAGNVAVIVMKAKGKGWQIVVATKGGR